MSREQAAWAARVERETKGPLERLSTKLEDGRTLRPLYTEADAPPSGPLPGQAPFVRGGRAAGSSGAEVWCRVAGPDLERAHRGLMEDLAGGAGGLVLPAFGPEALPLETSADFARLLSGVRLEAITLALEPSPKSKTWASALLAQGPDHAQARIHFGFDPLATVSTFGGDDDAVSALFDDAAWAVTTLGPSLPRSRALGASSVPYHEAGASPDFELAAWLGAVVATLRALDARGVPPEKAAAQLSATLPVDADFMLGIVKLRAARALLWRVLAASGVPDPLCAPPLLAISSRRMLTAFEPFTNALRAGAATFAALAGGADAVEVAPYDERTLGASVAARRLARNTGHILLEESHVARVLDPAGGAYFFEAETRALAESAWATFRGLEAEGGLPHLLQRGQVAMVAEANHFKEERRVSLRERALTGITEFAEPSLGGPTALQAAAHPPAPALMRRTLADPFERLRAASERYRSEHGRHPEVQLVTLGPRSEHDARTTWITNLLATAGLVVTAEERPVVIVSGADLRYETEAAPLAEQLRSDGRVKHLSLAGQTKHEPALRLAGYDSFIFRGEDVVRFLAELQIALGVSR